MAFPLCGGVQLIILLIVRSSRPVDNYSYQQDSSLIDVSHPVTDVDHSTHSTPLRLPSLTLALTLLGCSQLSSRLGAICGRHRRSMKDERRPRD